MANPFDQFDSVESGASNPFDQFDAAAKPAKKQGILGDLKDTLVEGTKSAGRSIAGAANVYTGNESGLVEKAKAQEAAVKPVPLQGFYDEVKNRVEPLGEDPGLIDSIKAVGGAVANKPYGAGLAVVEQLPNAAPAIGGALLGAKGGAALGAFAGPVGAAVGGIAGGIAGMFIGNSAIETGYKGIGAAQDGSVTPEEFSRVKSEGAVKGGVITAVDAATLGLSKAVTSIPGRAVESATRNALTKAGVDVADEAAVLAARRSPEISAAVRAAQDSAFASANTIGKRAAAGGAALGLETVGEGLGEYFGELAATGRANVADAVLEGLMSLGQSGAEVAWGAARNKEQNKANTWDVAAQQERPAPTMTADPVPVQQRIDAMMGIDHEVMNDKDRAQYEKDLAAAFLEPVGFTSDANGLEIPFTMADYLNGQVRAEDESRAQPLRQQAGQSADARLQQIADEESTQQPDISPAARGIAAAPVIPVVGPLSAVANMAVQSGAHQATVMQQAAAAAPKQGETNVAAGTKSAPQGSGAITDALNQGGIGAIPGGAVQKNGASMGQAGGDQVAAASPESKVAPAAAPVAEQPKQYKPDAGIEAPGSDEFIQSRNDNQLNWLAKSGNPILKPMAVAELAKRNGEIAAPKASDSADIPNGDGVTDQPTDTGIPMSVANQEPIKNASPTAAMVPAEPVVQNQEPIKSAEQPASADPALQNRDRGRAASVNQMQSIARNPDYMRLGPSRTPDSGAPMVFAVGGDTNKISTANMGGSDIAVMADGQRVPFRYAVVDARSVEPSNFADGATNPAFASNATGTIKALNNGRTAGVRAAHDGNTAANYTAELLADQAHGVSPAAIRNTPNPMLVRVYAEQANTGDMAAKSQGQGLGMSASERATQDAELMTSDVLDKFAPGDIASAGNRDFVRSFVGKLAANDVADLMDAAGNLSQDGRRRIEAALLTAAYGKSDLVQELFESTDTDIKAIGNALKVMSGQWAAMRQAAKEGSIDPATDMTANLIEAVNIVRRSRADGSSIAELAGQGDLMGGNYLSELSEGFLRIFYKGKNYDRARGGDKVISALQEIVTSAMNTKADAGLFGDSFKATPKQIVESARSKIDEENKPASQSSLFGANGQATAVSQGNNGEGAAQSGEVGQRPIGTGRSEETGKQAEPVVNRGDVGASLTKEQRTSTIKTLVDVYRKNNAPKEFKGVDNNGNERSGYAYSPEYFVKSDITGSMVRYYVTLPDGRIAHPTELFADYTQSDVDAAMQKEIDAERNRENAEKFERTRLLSLAAPTINEANGKFNHANRHAEDRNSIVPALLTNGELYLRSRPENADKTAKLLGDGWRVEAVAPAAQPKAAEPSPAVDAKKQEEAKPAIETDQARVQEIKNSIDEGELILKSGKTVSGRKMDQGEIDSVQRSVDSAKRKIGDTEEKLPEVIDDFGEKLGGARKDAMPSMAASLSDDEIATQPLSKIWPANEIDTIEDPFIAAVAYAARAEVPAKPRVAYKVARWVEKVKTVRNLAQRILDGSIAKDRFTTLMNTISGLDGFAAKVALLEAIDRKHWGRIGYVREHPDAYRYGENGEKIASPSVYIRLDDKHKEFPGAKSVADIVDQMSEALGEGAQAKKMQFEVRGKKGSYSINKKGDKEYRILKTFADSKEAFAFIKDNYADLVAAWDGVKESDNVSKTDVRNEENRPRTGKDRRDGKDVTPEQFSDTFGFRGVEFGLWVKQGGNAKDRQGMLNQAFDAMHDLAEIVGIPPKAISLNGTLGLGFGSRGKGAASAHFEPGNLVINLTKTRGAGTLAHEWFHALDNYFARMRNGGNQKTMAELGNSQEEYRRQNFVTYRPEPLYVHKTKQSTAITRAELARYHAQAPGSSYYDPANWHKDPSHPEGVRTEVESAFAELVNTLNAAPMAKRARLIDKAANGYWSRIIERGARSFENYIITKMMEGGYNNDYLANVRPVEDFPRSKSRYPYLLPDEVAPIAEAFDSLFDTIQTKETDSGVMLYNIADDETNAASREDVTALETAKRRIAKFVDAYLAGDLDENSNQLLGETPTVIQAIGKPNLQMEIDYAAINKVLSGKHRLDISPELLKKIPEGIYDPAAIFVQDNGSVLMITNLVAETGNPVAVAIHFRIENNRMKVNRIASVFEYNRFGSRLIEQAKNLRYVKNEKALVASTTPDTPNWSGMVQKAQELGINVLNESDVVNLYGSRYAKAGKGTISPADKAIYGMAAEGKSAADILKFIASASRSPFNRQVAKLLLKTGISPTVKVGATAVSRAESLEVGRGNSILSKEISTSNGAASNGGSNVLEQHSLLRHIDDLLKVPVNLSVLGNSAQGVDGNTSPKEGLFNRMRLDAETLRNVIQKQSFIEKGFGGLDAETQRAVLAAVLRSVKNNKVFNSVVELIPVDMVDMLRREQLTPKVLLNDPAMLKDSFASNLGLGVSATTDMPSALVRAFALSSAEEVSGRILPDVSRLTKEFFVANGAVNNGSHAKDYTRHGDAPVNKYSASYSPRTDTVTLFNEAQAERDALHEFVHAATLKALSKKGMAAAQMNALYQHVKKSGKLKGMYGMANLDEFVAEVFSNPKFQAMLKQVSAAPVGGKPSSAWDWFIRVVRGILGLKQGQDNALSQALDIGVGVMRENMRLQSGDGVIRFNHALRSTPEGNRPLNATRLAELRRIAAGLERPKDAVFLRVTEDGKAITTGPKGVRIPETFIRFAESNGLDFEARRNGEGRKSGNHTVGDHITSKTEPMPEEYRESGALYFGEGNEFFDRTGKTRYNAAPGKINQTDTEAFKKWFGDSRVVGANGKPLVVYHGAPDVRGIFAEGFKGVSRGGVFFAAADYGVADSYALDHRASDYQNAEPQTIPLFLSIKNPMVVDAKGANWKETERHVQEAKDAGHDGIIIKNSVDYYNNPKGKGKATTIYAWFHPTQAKSAVEGNLNSRVDLSHMGLGRTRPIDGATGNNGDFDGTNPDIRYNVAEEGWSVSEPSKLDDVIYAMQDKQVDMKRVIQSIMKTGKQIKDNVNAYLQEELFHGRASKGVKDFLDFELRPLLKEMQQGNIDMGDFEEYLWNAHAQERNEQIAKVNPEMKDGGSGIKTADAKAYLAALSPELRGKYQALAARVNAINKASQQALVDSGLEKQETIDAWNGAYQHYVPLQREDVDSGHIGTGKGFSIRGSSTKRALGSGRKVVDIIANLTMQRERNIVRAEKNRVTLAVRGLAMDNPNADFWTVDQAPKERVIENKAIYTVMDSEGRPNEFTRMADAEKFARSIPGANIEQTWQDRVTERVVPGFSSRDNVLLARVNGEDKYVIFNERDERAMRMAGSLKNLDVDNMGRVLSIVGKATRYLASINTQYNPVFGVINLVRDTQGALINLSSTPLAGEQKRVLGYTKDALVGIYKDIRDHRAGRKPSSKWAALFEEFQNEGGQTGYRDQYANAEARAESIISELVQFKEGKAKQLTRGVFGWLSDYNETMENAVRLAAYKAGTEKGMSKQQAASLAKNITVNFNRKGQVATQIGALYAFFNASVQGTARLAETLFDIKDGDIRTAKLSKAGKKIMAGGIMLGAMQALLLAAAGFGDDEPPEFIRERNLILPTGDGKYLTLAMPLGFHVIPGIGRIATEFVLGGGKDPLKHLAAFFGMFADTFNPVGSAGFSLQTITPSVIDPLAALAENKDFTGKEIYRKDFNPLNPTPGHARAKDVATVWSRYISEAMNFITGGTEFKPGMFSPSPDSIDYLLSQLTGGVGREVNKTAQTIGAGMSGEELPLHKIPLVGRFIGDTEGQSGESKKFYDAIKQINMHEAEYKGLMKDGRQQEAREYMAENPATRLMMAGNHTESVVRKLRNMKRDLVEQDAEKDQVRAIDERITATMRAFNERAKAAI